LGSNYWQEQGAKVIAHVDTAHEIEELGHDVYERMKLGRRDKSKGTKLTMPDITFEEDYLIKLGDEVIEVKNLGPAHSPGDIVVWLPKQKLVISGDVAFHERLLPVFEVTDTDGWIETWDAFVGLGAEIIIPGHGGPTNYVEVTKYTHDYLVFMREKLGEVIDNGGTLEEAYLIDQAPYQHLDTFYELARRNAGRIFQEMEFEF
jgi:glyoxylase-like metal-dependent hydrolase (beta-lactamase superfamily II)